MNSKGIVERMKEAANKTEAEALMSEASGYKQISDKTKRKLQRLYKTKR